MALRIKKDDMVVVLAGKYKGTKGKVLRVFPVTNRAIVEGVNYIHRHTRPNPDNPKGGVVKREGTIHLSNLALYCPKCDKGVRFRTVKENKDKKRVCVHCGEAL
ncbi:MAG TPA: 50S ribosomal protein L24 [Candidatus Mcinerneyibacteriales bacterium]|jgi:large subunit ribosomal protein L24|nr:50S ribosomal protein L24 [Candidatus Mcinerneyibacteriales bacterium]